MVVVIKNNSGIIVDIVGEVILMGLENAEHSCMLRTKIWSTQSNMYLNGDNWIILSK